MFLRKSFPVFCTVLFVAAFFSVGSMLVVAAPPPSGDWIVTGTESYSDQTIVLNGNLIVEDGGNLTLRRVTLKLNCHYDGEYNITVNYGGGFYVLDGSVITSATPDNEYTLEVRGGSTFRMNNSELHECGWWVPMAPPNGPWLQSDDAIVENSLISNNVQGINIVSDGVVVRNNTITANWHLGIGVWAPESPIICGNNISANGQGIHVAGGSSPTISDNTIALNEGPGICSWDKSHPLIANNTITSNGGTGVEFWNQSNPTIQDNLIALNSGWAGILFYDGCNATIRGNNITSNNGGGIISKEKCSGKIEGNMITNNTLGIEIGHGSNITVQGNIITTNRGDGFSCYDNSHPEVHWNDIYSNQAYNVKNDDPAVAISATNNYWGDGPSSDRISGNVLYDPWLTKTISPSAQITSPLSGETVSSTVKVSTEVHAPNGLRLVESYMDSQLRYTGVDPPYEWNWDTTQYTETEHKITAKVYDEFGLKISTSITVFVDNTSPIVSIKEPLSGSMCYGMMTISVNATDNREVSTVRVRVDNGAWLIMTYNSTDLLWKIYSLNSTTLSDGQHTFMALALDRAGNPATTSITVLIDNNPPTLSIQSPTSGITVGLTLTVNVQANDVSNISRVEFYLHNVLVHTAYTAPYQWAWDTTKYPNGEYTIIVKAYDAVGNVKGRDVAVTVNNVEVPWWQANFWAIIQAVIALGALLFGVITYWSRTREKRLRKKTKEPTNLSSAPTETPFLPPAQPTRNSKAE